MASLHLMCSVSLNTSLCHPQQSSLPPEIYCDLLETASDKCAEYSLLELWKFKEDRIRSLTQQGRDSIEKKLLRVSFEF